MNVQTYLQISKQFRISPNYLINVYKANIEAEKSHSQHLVHVKNLKVQKFQVAY